VQGRERLPALGRGEVRDERSDRPVEGIEDRAQEHPLMARGALEDDLERRRPEVDHELGAGPGVPHHELDAPGVVLGLGAGEAIGNRAADSRLVIGRPPQPGRILGL
jgi:hypothetical protein